MSWGSEWQREYVTTVAKISALKEILALEFEDIAELLTDK